MNIWLTTDTHFNHDKMLEYCDRPMGFEYIIYNNLAESVKEGDLLFHLGDVSFGKDEEMHQRFIQPLPCNKVLVKGNHDKKSNSWYLDNGWDFVCDLFIDRDEDETNI